MRYKVGDIVWMATFDNVPVTKTCPICNGDLKVTLILGNGTHISLPCDYCGNGYESPKGYIEEYEYVAEPKRQIITTVNIAETCVGEEIEYRSNQYCLYPDKMFDTKEDAMQYSNELAAKYTLDRETKADYIKKNQNKSYSWNAGYHMREVTRSKKQVEYHEKMAVICKTKSN